MAEGGVVSEICVSNRLSGKKKNNNNKDSTEIRKTIKDSNVLESFNNKDSTEIRKTIKDSNVLESFNKDSTEIRKTKDSNVLESFNYHGIGRTMRHVKMDPTVSSISLRDACRHIN